MKKKIALTLKARTEYLLMRKMIEVEVSQKRILCSSLAKESNQCATLSGLSLNASF